MMKNNDRLNHYLQSALFKSVLNKNKYFTKIIKNHIGAK